MALMLLEAKWKTALSSILEELTDSQFRKMLLNLVKIPQGVKDGKAREDIPYLIVQYYGTEDSISVIDKEMKNIPRHDAAVQEPLRPFVEKLKKQRQGKKGTTRKLSIDYGSVAKKLKPAADQLKSSQPDQIDPVKAAKPKKKPKKKTEKQDSYLKHQASASASTNMDRVGAVETEKTEEQDLSLKPVESIKTFKVLSAAVQTGKIQIMGIKKSNKTNTHLVVEFNKRKRNVFMTTRLLANAFGLKVEDDFERQLRYQMPLTAEAKLQGKKVTDIKKMDPVGDVKPDQKTEEQDLSLNLSAPYKTFKVQSAAVQTGRIQIVGIKKSNQTNTHLVVKFNSKTRNVFVTTRLLANTFGLEVDDDFDRRLRHQITAEAKLQGKKITEIKKMSLKLLEAKWKTALSSILEELTEPEFRKMLFNLAKIPQGVKTGKAREYIPDLIVQYYGTEGSISEIDKIMKNIPRQDAAVQEPLRPFVEKLKKQRQGKKEMTRKLSIDSGSVAEKQKLPADQLKSCQPDQKKTISQLGIKAQAGKVVQSSAQCTNEKKKMDPEAVKPKKKTEKEDSSLKHQASASINMDPVGAVKPKKKTEKQNSSLKPSEISKTFTMDPVEAVKPKNKTEKQDSSLKTAKSSKTSKALGAAVQTGRIQIMEIKKSNKTNTHLEVEFNDRRQTVYVTSRLLANIFGIKVEDDFERSFRYLMPLTAEATLQGNKITDIKTM